MASDLVKLGKTQTILELSARTQHNVYFDNSRSADSDTFKRVEFPVSQWRDMGRPVEVTVTIVPGDTINE